PMSSTLIRPAWLRPGSIHRPGFAAGNVAVRSAVTATPATPPGDASTPLGTPAAPTATPRAQIASIAAATGPRGAPLAPVPSSASITSAVSAAIPEVSGCGAGPVR